MNVMQPLTTSPSPSLRPPRGTRILVVDDDDLLLAATRRRLERAGFVVRTRNRAIGSGEEVMEFQPHYVLLDVRMPALGGGQLGELIVDRFGDTLGVILFSGMDEDALRTLAHRVGALGYVRKAAGTSLVEQLYPLMERRPRWH